jgi:hypothetical protein
MRNGKANAESSSAPSDWSSRKPIVAAPTPGVFPKCRADFEFARRESGAAICQIFAPDIVSIRKRQTSSSPSNSIDRQPLNEIRAGVTFSFGIFAARQ